MAGHEASLVRPKQFQDPQKIAYGSPLAIQGIFLEIIRERFKPGNGLYISWNPDPTLSGIIIETSFNEETEVRNKVPAVFINRLQTIPSKTIVGDRVGTYLPSHLEGFGAICTTGILMECVSNDEGESAIIGDIVQYMVLASQDVIQREFGFYDMSHPTLSQTTPYKRDQDKWSTNIEFSVQFWIRWAQVPIRPLLQQIAQRVSQKGGDIDSYFTEITINSMRRANPAKGEVSTP